MKHIELIGPPGSGKSTIHAELVQRGHLGISYGSITGAMMQEVTNENILLNYLPQHLSKKYIKMFLESKRRNTAFEQFVASNPDFLDVLHTSLDSCVVSERETVFKTLKYAAERLQIGISATPDSGILCVDDGLVHRYMGTSWRCPDYEVPIESYFQSIPTPDLLIHVDAPIELCIERQYDRGRVTAEKGYWTKNDIWQDQSELHDLCIEVKNYMSSNTNIISIETTDDLQKNIDKICSSI